jgi:small-conductance mechanosensitive channel
MQELLGWYQALTRDDLVRRILGAALILLCGVVVAAIARRYIGFRRLHVHHQLVLRRAVGYAILAFAITGALRSLGVSLSALLGAAGILTVAIGFAAQTSASNVISGLFLMGEQPFVIGDNITVAGITGSVTAIDMLSVKLRTFDGVLVRIPNETMLKSNVMNLTHFPIRRYDLQLGVAYKEDLGHVRAVLLEVAQRIPICLEEPAPLILMQGFGESSVDLQFSVWTAQENWLDLRNTLYEQVKRAFDQADIEIPFPHRTLYAGSVTKPFPLEVACTRGASSKDKDPSAGG